MLVREESLPKTSIYSSKILFEQADSRNKKRMAQMLKRKTELSTKNKLTKTDNNKFSPKNSSSIPKIDESNDLSFLNIIRDQENNNNINNIINNEPNNNNQVIIDIKVGSGEEKDKNAISIINNYVKNDNFSAASNINNENNNYYNNSSTNNSNNNSYKDFQEKEVNISNLDNDSIDEIILNKEDEENTHGVRTSNLFDYDKDDDNTINKEENKIKEENEFALKYLSSSSDSFIQLDNKLVARVKAQGGDMTESYLQALFPQINLDNSKSLKNKNYEVIDIIKEEKEVESPLRNKNNKDYNKENEVNKENIDINLNISSESSYQFPKKKSTNKKSNYLLYKKNKVNMKKIDKNNISKDFKNSKNSKNNFNESKYKENLSFTNSQKILKKHNTISKMIINNKNNKNNKNSYLKNSSSFSNIKLQKDKKVNNNSFLYSSFSSNLYTKTKTEEKLNNIQKKFKKKEDLNDSLICNYINNINKPKNIKIKKIK